MTQLDIVRIPALSDNYIWLVHDPDSQETMVVDPGEAQPVLDAAAERGWTISQIWITHWHPDHTDGIAAIKDATGAKVTGPAAEAARIPTLDVMVAEGDTVPLGARQAAVWETPGHTAGHISLHLPDEQVIFVGDTMFAMGCGRLFEGTPAQMYEALTRIAGLPDETVVYGAHEYTQSNGRYALVAEPDNQAIRDRMAEVDRLRAAGTPTLPTTVGLEKATNPFVRAGSAEAMAERRKAKDNFKG